MLNLSPLYVWRQMATTDAWPSCLVLDGGTRGGSLSFKAIGSASSLSLDEPEHEELRAMAEEVLSDKCVAARHDGCKFVDAEGVVE